MVTKCGDCVIVVVWYFFRFVFFLRIFLSNTALPLYLPKHTAALFTTKSMHGNIFFIYIFMLFIAPTYLPYFHQTPFHFLSCIRCCIPSRLACLSLSLKRIRTVAFSFALSRIGFVCFSSQFRFDCFQMTSGQCQIQANEQSQTS